jgi:hypothetical protein
MFWWIIFFIIFVKNSILSEWYFSFAGQSDKIVIVEGSLSLTAIGRQLNDAKHIMLN